MQPGEKSLGKAEQLLEWTTGVHCCGVIEREVPDGQKIDSFPRDMKHEDQKAQPTMKAVCI